MNPNTRLRELSPCKVRSQQMVSETKIGRTPGQAGIGKSEVNIRRNMELRTACGAGGGEGGRFTVGEGEGRARLTHHTRYRAALMHV